MYCVLLSSLFYLTFSMIFNIILFEGIVAKRLIKRTNIQDCTLDPNFNYSEI